jgi:hypothetical protein
MFQMIKRREAVKFDSVSIINTIGNHYVQHDIKYNSCNPPKM